MVTAPNTIQVGITAFARPGFLSTQASSSTSFTLALKASVYTRT